jgi:trimeric autotransporter adhesin
MKKIKHLAAIVLILLVGVFGATAQNIGIGTATPDASALLDLSAINKGLLIPRVALTSLTDAVTITAPATGLLVYNTNGAVPGGAGFYYNSGKGSAVWVKLLSGSGSGWGLTGNATTDSTINFIGTTDLKPLVFRVNNGFAGQISTIGGISFGRGANGTTKIAEPGVIAIGDSALFSNLDNSNVGIGNGALYSNTTGTSNTAIGNVSLVSNVLGSANVAVGDFTLSLNDSSYNTAVGYAALSNTQEEQNSAVGAFAMSDNLGGFYNTAVGYAALTTNAYGFANTSVGRAALANNTDGIFNTASGFFSLISNQTGGQNTAFGAYALRTATTGSYNTAIGDSADVSLGTLFNTTTVGYKATATTSNSVRIGNTLVTSIGGQVGWSVLSDGRYKKDVSEDVKGLDFIMQLRPVTYHYDFEKVRAENYAGNPTAMGNVNNRMPAVFSTTGKLSGKRTVNGNFLLDRTNGSFNSNISAKTTLNPDLSKYYEEVRKNDQIRYTGFIAQEVEAAAQKSGFNFSGVDKPKNDTDQYSLRYAEFVVPLVKAVQEQQVIITSQNKKIDDLLKRIEMLEAAKQ